MTEHSSNEGEVRPGLLWLVALYEDGRWDVSWDGSLHTERETAESSAVEARQHGYTVVVCTVSEALDADG